MPPRLRFAKNTLNTAYPSRISRNRPTKAPYPFSAPIAARVRLPMLPFSPPMSCVRPDANVPCSVTHRRYSSTGTVVNRLTAIKPLIPLSARPCRSPRPDWDWMAYSKPATTSPTAYSIHANRLKNNTTACVHGRSNSSAPIMFIISKNSLKKPTSFP